MNLFKMMIGSLLLLPGLIWGQTTGELLPPLNGLSETDQVTLETVLSMFEPARYRLWQAEGDPEGSRRLLARASSTAQGLEDEAARTYMQARSELYIGRSIEPFGRKSEAQEHYQAAMDLARRSIEVRETSEGWRVLADAGSSMMVSKGFGGIISMAGDVKSWSEKALELDPQNVMAILIDVQGQINAPRIGGGNPEEALRRLTQLNRRADLNDIERFWTYLSLAAVNDKLRNSDEAGRWCAAAGGIFPENPMMEVCR